MFNKEKLKGLAIEYGFKIEKISDLVKITSKYDVWYMPDRDYIPGKTKIKLLHANKKCDAGWHHQGIFQRYEQVFNYIYNHDQKLFVQKPNKIDELLKQIRRSS